jgi:hypothetical protein
MVAQVTAIEAYKKVLNQKTDDGEFSKPVYWTVTKGLADLLGDGIHESDTLLWDPATRELIQWGRVKQF